MASMTAVNSSLLSAVAVCSVPKSAAAFSSSSSVSLGSSSRLRCVRLTKVSAPLSRPAFVVRAKDDGSNVVDAVKEGADQAAQNVKSGVNKAGEFVSDSASNIKEGAQDAVETVKDKASDLTGQAKSASQDLGNKAEDVKVNFSILYEKILF